MGRSPKRRRSGTTSRGKPSTARKPKAGTRAGRQQRGQLSLVDAQKLLALEATLKQRIVGKDDAIARVANTIRIRRTNLDFRPNRPDGAFLLVGPSGVGKTEFAMAVAEALLTAEEQMILLDMADYTEEADIDDLIVTLVPGDTDTLIEGSLTTPVRENPRSVILLRGLEQAHSGVRRLLLHVLDRGVITDAQGAVDFSQSILFATTRLHDEGETVEQIGFNRSSLSRDERTRRLLEEQLTPELVAAFNDVLHFSKLTAADVKKIARYKVNKVLERLKQQERGVVVSDQVYDAFITEDDVRAVGARYLNRALEEKLFTPLSKYLLNHAEARHIAVDVRGNQVFIHQPGR
jgi:ATP-dependent Clp protease ATP-binding subunit ClpA